MKCVEGGIFSFLNGYNWPVLLILFPVICLSIFSSQMVEGDTYTLIRLHPSRVYDYTVGDFRLSNNIVDYTLENMFLVVTWISSFLISLLYGLVSDRKGRKWVLIVSLFLSALSSVIFPTAIVTWPSIVINGILYSIHFSILVVAFASAFDHADARTQLFIAAFINIAMTIGKTMFFHLNRQLQYDHVDVYPWAYYGITIVEVIMIVITFILFPNYKPQASIANPHPVDGEDYEMIKVGGSTNKIESQPKKENDDKSSDESSSDDGLINQKVDKDELINLEKEEKDAPVLLEEKEGNEANSFAMEDNIGIINRIILILSENEMWITSFLFGFMIFSLPYQIDELLFDKFDPHYQTDGYVTLDLFPLFWSGHGPMLVIQVLILFGSLFQPDFFMFNWLRGYRGASLGMGILFIIYAFKNEIGITVYIVNGVFYSLFAVMQVCLFILLMNSVFRNESGFILAWVPKMDIATLLLLYPDICLSSKASMFILSACTIILGCGVSFVKLTKTLNRPRKHPRQRATHCNLSWLFCCGFPAFIALIMGIMVAFLLSNPELLYNFPCPNQENDYSNETLTDSN